MRFDLYNYVTFRIFSHGRVQTSNKNIFRYFLIGPLSSSCEVTIPQGTIDWHDHLGDYLMKESGRRLRDGFTGALSSDP